MSPHTRPILLPNLRLLCVAAVLALSNLEPARAATAGAGYTETKYPVVLIHGFLGFDNIAVVDYFYGVPKALREGGATVYTPGLSQVATNVERGEQLLAKLRQLKAAYGYQKFNLIGHSQGGTTARYVAEVAPELVASVTTVGTPHTGTKFADFVTTAISLPVLGPLAQGLINGLGTLIAVLSGSPSNPQDAATAVTAVNTPGALAFNKRFPKGAPTSVCGSGPAAVDGITYRSAGGTGVVTNPLDISDSLMLLASLTLVGEANDGIVGRCSTHWGEVIRDDYFWNHLDEINQAFGLRSWLSPDPVAFYRSQTNWLKLSGR